MRVQWVNRERVTAASVVAGSLMLVGALWATPIAAAAPPAKGTLVASGAVHGRWTMTSCQVGVSQGAERLTITFGPRKGAPVVAATAAIPLPASGKVNLAKAYNDFVEFESPSGSYWESGWVSGPTKDAGAGTLTMSRNATSGTLTSTMLKSGFPDVHVSVSWKTCPVVSLPEN
jgi:hypothetical protein